MKWAEETAWAVIVAALTYIVGVSAAGMPTDNWRVWVVTLAAGVGRVVFATFISRLGGKATPATPLVPAAEYTSEPTSVTVASTTAPRVQIITATPPDEASTLPRPVAASASPTS